MKLSKSEAYSSLKGQDIHTPQNIWRSDEVFSSCEPWRQLYCPQKPSSFKITSFKINSHFCVWCCFLLNFMSSYYEPLSSLRFCSFSVSSPYRVCLRGSALSLLCLGPKLTQQKIWTQSFFMHWITWNAILSVGVSVTRSCITLQKFISRCFK